IISYKLPSTLLIKMLKIRAKTPTNKDKILILPISFLGPLPRLLNLFKISSEITEEVEFKPEDKLDMAAAKIPAATSPDMPTGKPTRINLGKRLSAFVV